MQANEIIQAAGDFGALGTILAATVVAMTAGLVAAVVILYKKNLKIQAENNQREKDILLDMKDIKMLIDMIFGNVEKLPPFIDEKIRESEQAVIERIKELKK